MSGTLVPYTEKNDHLREHCDFNCDFNYDFNCDFNLASLLGSLFEDIAHLMIKKSREREISMYNL